MGIYSLAILSKTVSNQGVIRVGLWDSLGTPGSVGQKTARLPVCALKSPRLSSRAISEAT